MLDSTEAKRELYGMRIRKDHTTRALSGDAHEIKNLEQWKRRTIMKSSNENLRLVSQEQQYEDEENAQPEEATQRTVTKGAHKTILVYQNESGRKKAYHTRPSKHHTA